MIRIRCNNYHAESTLKDFYNKNIDNNRKPAKIKKLDRICKQYFAGSDLAIEKYEDIVIADPTVLKKIVSYINKRISNEKTDTLKTQLEDGNKEAYTCSTLYSKMEKAAKKIIADVVRIKVCPYCNRKYLNFDEGDYTLDHFYPKGKYPLLAASFYNLIPCCYSCNKKKGEEPLKMNPYEMTEDLFDFSYGIKRCNFMDDDNHVFVVPNHKRLGFDEENKVFHFKEMYGQHRNIIREYLKKNIIYSEEYIDELFSHYKGKIFVSKEDVEACILGVYGSEESIGSEPLDKMKWDIYLETSLFKKI